MSPPTVTDWEELIPFVVGARAVIVAAGLRLTLSLALSLALLIGVGIGVTVAVAVAVQVRRIVGTDDTPVVTATTALADTDTQADARTALSAVANTPCPPWLVMLSTVSPPAQLPWQPLLLPANAGGETVRVPTRARAEKRPILKDFDAWNCSYKGCYL